MNKPNPLLLLFLIICSCAETVKFTEPQPIGKKTLREIPIKLRGNYYSEEDSTHLIINKNKLIKWSKTEFHTVKDSIPIDIDELNPIYYTKDSVQIIESGYDVTLKFGKADSVKVYYSHRDTVFTISETELLKRYKGQYFLNYLVQDSLWDVQLLTLGKGLLKFSNIKEEPKSTKNSETADSLSKENSELLTPNRKELLDLIESRFTEFSTYKKVN